MWSGRPVRTSTGESRTRNFRSISGIRSGQARPAAALRRTVEPVELAVDAAEPPGDRLPARREQVDDERQILEPIGSCAAQIAFQFGGVLSPPVQASFLTSHSLLA